MQFVVNRVQAELDSVITAGIIIKIYLKVGLVYVEGKFIGINRILIAGNIVLIPVIPGCEKRIQLIAKNMLPFN
jgi:hypothetical protein